MNTKCRDVDCLQTYDHEPNVHMNYTYEISTWSGGLEAGYVRADFVDYFDTNEGYIFSSGVLFAESTSRRSFPLMSILGCESYTYQIDE